MAGSNVISRTKVDNDGEAYSKRLILDDLINEFGGLEDSRDGKRQSYVQNRPSIHVESNEYRSPVSKVSRYDHVDNPKEETDNYRTESMDPHQVFITANFENYDDSLDEQKMQDLDISNDNQNFEQSNMNNVHIMNFENPEYREERNDFGINEYNDQIESPKQFNINDFMGEEETPNPVRTHGQSNQEYLRPSKADNKAAFDDSLGSFEF